MYPSLIIDSKSYIGKNCYIKCADNSTLEIINTSINKGSVIVADHGGIIKISNSFIGGNSWIVARLKIHISNSLVGEMVSIRDNNHDYRLTSELVSQRSYILKPVNIKNNTWLGSKVTVLAGTTINENTVIAANAVARGNLLENSIYAGVPVKKIK